jgi:hypothetical protein
MGECAGLEAGLDDGEKRKISVPVENQTPNHQLFSS